MMVILMIPNKAPQRHPMTLLMEKKLSQAIVNVLENSQAKVYCQCDPTNVIFKKFADSFL